MCSPDFCPTAASPVPCCCCPPGLKAWNNPVAFEFSEEQKASKRLTSDRGLCSMFAEDDENSSWGGYEESRFSLPGSGGGDAFQNSIIQHSSHVLASCQPALWKGMCNSVNTVLSDLFTTEHCSVNSIPWAGSSHRSTFFIFFLWCIILIL